jgi:hypothetical protein
MRPLRLVHKLIDPGLQSNCAGTNCARKHGKPFPRFEPAILTLRAQSSGPGKPTSAARICHYALCHLAPSAQLRFCHV